MSGHRTIVNATKNATATAGRSKSSTTPWNLQALPQVADVRCVATIIFGLSCQHRSEGKQRSRQKRDGAVCPSEKFIATRFPGTRGPEDCCWSEWRNCSFIGAPGLSWGRGAHLGAQSSAQLSLRHPPTSDLTDSEQTYRFRILYVSHPTYCHTVLQLPTNFQQCLENI
jgi:hypothetical protein